MDKVDQRSDMEKVILIVDDELDMRIFLSTLVKTSGFIPVVAKDGKDGLQKARDTRPDLLILDVMMPGEGGVMLYYKIKTDTQLRNTPVIMLSAIAQKTFNHYLSMLAITLDATVAPPEAYMEKPPDADELIRIIKRIIG